MEYSPPDVPSINYYQKYGVKTDEGPLGDGSFGTVYKGFWPGTTNIIAMKVVAKEAEGITASTLREIALLQSFEHANIVKLLKVEQDKTSIYYIFEHLDLSLMKFLKDRSHELSVKRIKGFMRQILSAIMYCHDRNIMHRDLKPENLMITGETLKVIDFGLARVRNVGRQNFTPNMQTMFYKAPEILMGAKDYTCSLDMWSIGCIFAEMITTKALFAPIRGEAQIICIFNKLGKPTEESWPGVTCLPAYPKDDSESNSNSNSNSFVEPQGLSEFVGRVDQSGLDLLAKLLRLNPLERISAEEALNHPFLVEEDEDDFLSEEEGNLVG